MLASTHLLHRRLGRRSSFVTGSEVTVGRVLIRKGMSNPRHGHRNCEEVLYLLSGRLEHHIGDRKMLQAPGDTVAIPAGVMHHAVSVGPEDADMIVAYSSGVRDFVVER